MTNTEKQINPKAQEYITHYMEACDPLAMTSLLMQFGRIQRNDLTDEEYRQIAGCHNLLIALYRNE